MLQEQREQCLNDGYMLPTADFDRLHYEDPRVTELKLMDVRSICIIKDLLKKNTHFLRVSDCSGNVQHGGRNYLQFIRETQTS